MVCTEEIPFIRTTTAAGKKKKKKRKVFCAQNLLEAVTDSVLSVQQVPAL